MVKLKIELAQVPQAIDLPVAPRCIVSPSSMLPVVRERLKLASTIKVTIHSQAEADHLMAQGIIIAGKTQVTDRHFEIAPDVQCPTCAE